MRDVAPLALVEIAEVQWGASPIHPAGSSRSQWIGACIYPQGTAGSPGMGPGGRFMAKLDENREKGGGCGLFLPFEACATPLEA